MGTRPIVHFCYIRGGKLIKSIRTVVMYNLLQEQNGKGEKSLAATV